MDKFYHLYFENCGIITYILKRRLFQSHTFLREVSLFCLQITLICTLSEAKTILRTRF
ncbi:hypothetical protein E2C01_028346 [Portunus trituberculatus]|uniref:Uncharacterized protein n=1 Tax=Portunus trituberculatus TaxID=210409 RepID=A0A5B7EL43_PORTR|nr:hypothetical protein [Portunus trituberculatus]